MRKKEEGSLLASSAAGQAQPDTGNRETSFIQCEYRLAKGRSQPSLEGAESEVS